nr:restriction endonuclease subunit S [Bacillus velezensis]
MSKKKKTIEELLEEAIIPEEKERFVIPKNWIWTQTGSITDVIGGGTPKSTVKEYFEDGDIPWLTPADLSGYNDMYISRGKRNITEVGLANSSAKILPSNTVLLSSRAPIGYVTIASNDICTNQGFKSFLPSNAYYPEYLYWYLKFSTTYLESMASGTTFKELSGSKCKEIALPLPSLNEQKRIANKVERLLNKVEEAKQLIEEAKETFELRRAAILDKAFRGELTRKWREEHPDIENAEVLYDKIISLIKPKKFEIIEEQSEYIPCKWKWVRLGEVVQVNPQRKS